MRKIRKKHSDLRAFFEASIFWLFASLTALQGLLPPQDRKSTQLGFGMLWLVAVADLFVLRRLFLSITERLAASDHQKPRLTRQIWLWGHFKVICMGLFVLILLEGQKFTLLGHLLGIGTLWAVPLVGGFLWNWRELKRK